MNKFEFNRPSEISKNANVDLQQLKAGAINDAGVLLHLYYSLEFAIGQVLADGDESRYPNASYSVLRFIDILRSIKKLSGVGKRFLDVGCGLGNKVWIAQVLEFDAYGLDSNEKYVEIARDYIGANRIFCRDGITFQDYSQYDVIYFYNPMPSMELEAAIFSNVKNNAIIFHAIGLKSRPKREFIRMSPYVMQITDEVPKHCFS